MHDGAVLHAAVLELPRSIGLEELKLVICKYTQGALLPGRVFRVRRPPVFCVPMELLLFFRAAEDSQYCRSRDDCSGGRRRSYTEAAADRAAGGAQPGGARL